MIYPIEPVAKPRMTQRDRWKKRPCVLHYRAFKDKCRVHRVELPQPCKVVFHIPMPRSWKAFDRDVMDGLPHIQKPDLDNLLKGLCDAVLLDDSKVWSVHAEKRWSRRAGIEIIPMEVKLLWSALDKTNQTVDALDRRVPVAIPVVTQRSQHCPAPDYRSEREPELCGCEEALALRAENAELRRRLGRFRDADERGPNGKRCGCATEDDCLRRGC
jgi:Holliday junction resolvase RusA-like endonuclease